MHNIFERLVTEAEPVLIWMIITAMAIDVTIFVVCSIIFPLCHW